MDLALNFIQMEKSDIKGNIKMMNIMVKERKYMKMEITILDYGMVWMINFYISMDLVFCIIKKVKLFIKESGNIINIK